MKKSIIAIFIVSVIGFITLAMYSYIKILPKLESISNFPNLEFSTTLSPQTSILEAPTPDQSSNTHWWLNSGGSFYYNGEYGQTLIGSLSEGSDWQIAYSKSNPTDTNNGHQPQNIFRLITRSEWYNTRTESYIRIKALNESSSPNHNNSNGISLLSRIDDFNNLYITTLRSDGGAVIKKKYNGTYYNLSYIPDAWVETENHNLPLNTWIGLAFEVADNSLGQVVLNTYISKPPQYEWRQILSTTDNEDVPPHKQLGRSGIRTDFMDIDIKNIKIWSR